MKRLICLLLATLFCVAALTSCAQNGEEKDVPSGMARARSAALDLWVFYPENWLVAENGEYLKLVSAEQNSLEGQMSAGDVVDGAAVLPSNIANVSVFRLKEGVTDLKEYAEGEWKQSFSSSFVFDSEVESRKIGKNETYTVHYQMVGGKDQTLYCFSQTMILYTDAVYAVTFSATPELYDIWKSVFGDIVQSLTFEEVAPEDNTPLTAPADAPVAEEEGKIAQKDGYLALTNRGVDYVLYYPDTGWSVQMDSGFSALRTESGANVSVVRGDALAAQILTPTDYLERQVYPSFDTLYGSHTELSREEVKERTDAQLLVATYTASVGGEEFTFRQAIFWRGGYVYTLLYTAKTSEYETYLGDVEKMIEQFTFKQ